MNGKSVLAEVLDGILEIVHKPLGEKGEDAFAYSFQDPGLHAMAVFDGCCGAGAWQYPEYKGATGAFVAAQSMAKLFLPWQAGIRPEVTEHPEELAKQLETVGWMKLQKIKEACSPMGVSGSLVKAFPCTVSAALIKQSGMQALQVTALNVGDSRIYYLAPDAGLVQLTEDDSRGRPDPLESLRGSAPLSDMMNADRPFKVKVRQIELPLPCAVLAATDGMFGYLRSPMDFEYMLLDCLMRASSLQEFEERFKSAVAKATGDDSTCIAAFYGWGSLNGMKQKLQARYDMLREIVRIMDEAAQDAEKEEAVIREIWKHYKETAVAAHPEERDGKNRSVFPDNGVYKR